MVGKKGVVLINPKGGELPFDCPVKLMKFLDDIYYKQYIDHGALPYEWKWEVRKDVAQWGIVKTTIQYYEYKVSVFDPENRYKIWDTELDRCVYESGSFDTIEDALADAKFNIDETVETPDDR